MLVHERWIVSLNFYLHRYHGSDLGQQCILPVDARVLFNFKGLLRFFLDSSGLHVNFSKTYLVPINTNPAFTLHLANTLGCKV